MVEATELEAVVDSLTQSFLTRHPREAAKRLQMMSDQDAADVLKDYPIDVSAPVIESLSPQAVGAVMPRLSSEIARQIIEYIDPGNGAPRPEQNGGRGQGEAPFEPERSYGAGTAGADRISRGQRRQPHGYENLRFSRRLTRWKRRWLN